MRTNDSPGGDGDPGDPGSEAACSFGAEPLFAGVGAVCDTVVRLTGVDGAAVAVLTRNSRIRELVYATDALAQQIDELQFTLGEGPCLDAYTHGRPQRYPCLDDDAPRSRFPLFTADIAALGVQAIFAFLVPGTDRPMGVLELYRRTAGDLGPVERNSATVCAVAVKRTLEANWDTHRAALPTNYPDDVINAAADRAADPDEPIHPFTRSHVYVAAGMVAVQLAVTPEEALDRLRAYAYSHGRPVTEVAIDIVKRRLSLRDQRDSARD